MNEEMAKSPTLSLKSREIIGSDLFSRRREVFGQHDTVFLPSPPVSPTRMEVEEVTERGKNISSFRRTPAYSSMRETRKDDIRTELGFRERKLSDNFTSDLNQSDIDYRHSMTERTRRLSKLRRDFLTSNLHEPTNVDPFARIGTRASMPVRSPGGSFKVSSNIYKFPFAEPYSTPPQTRKVFLDFGPSEVDGETKENKDPKEEDDRTPNKHLSLPSDKATQMDHHKMFNELVKRYSPQAKPIDWTLPPTKPRVVGAWAKPISIDLDDKLEIKEDNLEIVEEKLEIKENNERKSSENDDVFIAKRDTVDATLSPTKEINSKRSSEDKNGENNSQETEEILEENKRLSNDHKEVNGQLKDSSDELDEKYDKVPEIPKISRQNSREPQPMRSIPKDETIPALLEKISHEDRLMDPEGVKDKKKVKRKRSFLDKLLNRNKK